MKIQKHVTNAYFITEEDAIPFMDDAQAVLDNALPEDDEEEFYEVLAFELWELSKTELEAYTLEARNRYERSRNRGVRRPGSFIAGFILVSLDGYGLAYAATFEDFMQFEAAGFDTGYYNANIRILPFPLPFGTKIRFPSPFG